MGKQKGGSGVDMLSVCIKRMYPICAEMGIFTTGSREE
jgi:hypothetical protein